MGSLLDQAKVEAMNYDEAIEAFRNILGNEKEFDEILENFKKYNENYKITRFPLRKLKDLLKKEKKDYSVNLLDELKKEYVNIFKNYYKQHSHACGRFYEIFKNVKDYNELIKEQKNYFEYKNLEKTYKKKLKLLNFQWILHYFYLIMLE